MKNYIKLIIDDENYVLYISYIASFTIAFFVYHMGGTYLVYANLMYLPIALCSSTNNRARRLFHAFVSGILVGPFIPLNVSEHIPQDNFSWIIRLFIYFIISFIIGNYSDYFKKEYEKKLSKEKELSNAHISTIYALAKLTESRNNSTGSHLRRVGELCKELSIKLRELPKYKKYITENYISSIKEACLLHDIGKVAIADQILLKPEKLSDEEFKIMKSHTEIGANVLKSLKKECPNNEFIELGINIANYHHEKWDGQGYPSGLKGEKIPLSARIMSISDVYDALRSERTYKNAYSHKESIKIIKNESGKTFDPEIVNIFVENERHFENIFNNYNKN